MKQSRRRKKTQKMNKIISWRADKISFKKQTKSWHAVEEKKRKKTIQFVTVFLRFKTFFERNLYEPLEHTPFTSHRERLGSVNVVHRPQHSLRNVNDHAINRKAKTDTIPK
jgi:hypothetical protein